MSEYRPTEYVVDFGDCRSNQFVRLNMALIEQNSAKLHERIVRCRDCRYFEPDGEHSEVYPDCYWCDKLTVYMPTDGFCSFGKRKEGGE